LIMFQIPDHPMIADIMRTGFPSFILVDEDEEEEEEFVVNPEDEVEEV